ncbi:MAG: transposase [Sedimentisphaerales bacterium]|nr:transposase [Sedimentisphaerales bacterium]
MKKYIVTLTKEERQRLQEMLSRGKTAARFEWHYTPKHGSWLDIAEIELGILSRQCLSRRIDNIETLREETAAWEGNRDAAEVKVNWQFTTTDARIKLKSLYPSMDG